MVLSVIIVNYRVPYFLDLCLQSVELALRDLDAEIIVVDNHSADNSLDLLRPRFPNIKWLINKDNLGFARANNQALTHATGEYLLFLNPDTILPEDFAHKILKFIASNFPLGTSSASGTPTSPIPRLGALGPRMIDGSGKFLKESRRGFPTPWVAFCKLSGLTTLFPQSRRFAQYYLGHLPESEPHPAAVLSGACLWVSHAALRDTGPFDETFFMYAEDIDLSYRLENAGYTNYYFPDTTIIHFKGESTRKDIRYTRQFYKAMIQFRRKHFNTGLPGLFRLVIEPAIWLRASLSALKKRFTKVRPSSEAQPSSKPRPSSTSRRTWLTGDPEGIAKLQPALSTSQGRSPAPDQQHADEIVYCIGNQYSFKNAINALEKKPPAQIAAFCTTTSLAVISSSRRDSQGEIWVL